METKLGLSPGDAPPMAATVFFDINTGQLSQIPASAVKQALQYVCGGGRLWQMTDKSIHYLQDEKVTASPQPAICFSLHLQAFTLLNSPLSPGAVNQWSSASPRQLGDEQGWVWCVQHIERVQRIKTPIYLIVSLCTLSPAPNLAEFPNSTLRDLVSEVLCHLCAGLQLSTALPCKCCHGGV